MNKIILIGNLARDPEIRYSQAAEPLAICKFTLAVNRRFKREGDPDADFIFCVAFGKTAEFIERYFKKGKKIAVMGRLSIRPYEDKETGQKRSFTEVVIEEAHFVDSKSQSDQPRPAGAEGEDYYAQGAAKPYASAAPAAPAAMPAAPSGFEEIDNNLDDEELPF